MKVLIFGLGSIGQRHVRLLKSLSSKYDLEIGAYRSRKFNWVISDKLEANLDRDPCDFYDIKAFYSEEEAFDWEPDVSFITNPISMHVETALKAVRQGTHVFIEKPLGSSTKSTEALEKEIKSRSLQGMVGYQTRFHPAYQKIKEIIKDKILGDLTYASLHFGEWLPGMHPYEDYRISHASRKDEGGGVILCLSHEIDLCSWLFGRPLSVYATGGHLSSDLELDGVEDTANLSFTFKQEERRFPVNVHLDFIQSPPRREILIVGSKGKVEFNYHTNIFKLSLISPEKRTEEISYADFQRNDMFVNELEAFFDSIVSGKENPIPVKDGIQTLEICDACKESLASGELVKFNE